MLKSSPPYAIWSIWIYLSHWQKLFFLALCVVGIYSLFSATVTKVRLRTITIVPQKEDIASVQRALVALHKRSTKLQQLIGTAFYLFGLVLFLGLQGAYATIELSSTPIGRLVLENFLIYFAFASNVFFVFLIIHCVQWFVSGQVDRYASRLNTQHMA